MMHDTKYFLGLGLTGLILMTGPSPHLVQAETQEALTKLAEPVRASQSAHQVQIDYQPSRAQAGHKIYHAVWSDQDGQDDLRWYQAGEGTATVPLDKHKDYGLYHIHTYIEVDGQRQGLGGRTFTTEKPPLTVASSVSDTGFLNLHLTNVPNTSSDIIVPVWSNSLGQDDLYWHKAHKQEDGSYQLTVPLKHHHYRADLYHLHIYGWEEDSDQLKALAAQKFQVKEEHLPSREEQEPQLTLVAIDQGQGLYQVQIEDRPKSKPIKSLDIAVWSEGDRSNLHWYKVESTDSQPLISQIDLRHHQALAGHYQTHVYINYQDGSRSGHALDTLDFSQFKLEVSASSKYLGEGRFQLDTYDLYSPGPIRYAIWSEEGGQDDLRWYQAKQVASGHYQYQLDLQDHKATGLYHLHVYRWGQEPQGISAHSFQVEADMLPKVQAIAHKANHAGNLYPVGQCTWGVKGLAPWASNYWGNANTWHTYAQQQGFQVGTSPRAGAIAVWPQDGIIGGRTYGHVAYVTHVESATRIQVQEANYAGKQYIGNFRGWFNPQKIWQKGRLIDSPVYYIYPKG